eukprot:SAG11_NODE_36702_length_260_cov_0.913043_1_plen_46_part_01
MIGVSFYHRVVPPQPYENLSVWALIGPACLFAAVNLRKPVFFVNIC